MKAFKAILLSLAVLFPIAACSDLDIGTTNNKKLANMADNCEWAAKSHNVYGASDLCHTWYYQGAIRETYVDGVLTDTQVVSYDAHTPFDVRNDGTLIIGQVNSRHSGLWLYRNNLLVYKIGGSYWVYEVAQIAEGAMLLREEEIPIPEDPEPFYQFKPFIQDPSGVHTFLTLEYSLI